jgi:hypothetical protein
MSTENGSREPWSYQRIRSRLTTLIEVAPLAVGNEQLLQSMREDLIEIRAGLDQCFSTHERK